MPQAQKRRRRGQWPRKVREALPDRPVGTATKHLYTVPKVQALGATPTRRRCPVPGGSTRWFGPQGRLRRCARRDCVCHRADTQTVFRRCIASYPEIAPKSPNFVAVASPRGTTCVIASARADPVCRRRPAPVGVPPRVSVAPGSPRVFFHAKRNCMHGTWLLREESQ